MSEFDRNAVEAAIARARQARADRFRTFFVGLALTAGLLFLLIGILWMQGEPRAADPTGPTSITSPG